MLSALQNRLRDLIKAVPSLAGVPVIVEDKGNIAADVEAALATLSLCIVVAPSSGQAKSGQLRGRAASDEDFEIVIHRGLAEGTLTTVAVLEILVPLIDSAACDPAARVGNAFAFKRHELRENSDGSFARVLTVSCPHTWQTPPAPTS